MNIRFRNIPEFQLGGTFNLEDWITNNPEYYKWYSSLYPNAPILLGNPLKQRNNYWNKSQLSSSHYTTDDLRRSAYNNYLYTNDYNARLEDLTKWGLSQKDFGTISDQDFVNRYNKEAQFIREAREVPQTYNRTGYAKTNRIFRNMFYNRSKLGVNVPLYTIGYLENLDDIEGTSTWQRRMDRYEKAFENDTPEGQKNRTFIIKRPDGKEIKVYKKENGDIGLFPENSSEGNPLNGENLPEVTVTPSSSLVPVGHKERYGFDWNKIKEVGAKLFGSPEFIAAGRLAGNLLNNARVYDELLKGIRPDLRQTYLTHRQVVGDEATKLAYYRRAALGQTKAARPFTSDADRQMAYQYEAKRIGDELRAQGDIADNQEIRRTSDESNQHQWANIQRATEVANANIASINQANALKHNLLALKHSAQWTSIDNFLKDIEYRKRQRLAELQEFDDQIFALQTLLELLDDPRILEAKKRYLEVLEAHKKADGTYDTYNDEVIKAKNDYQKAQYAVSIDLYKKKKEYYLNRGGFLGTFFGKSGGKISVIKTKKKKDDLLYKSTRDAVEHFRKMSKISSDALNRKKPKIERLVPHPGSTRRYLQGGIAPFTVFTPVTLGGETTTRSQVSSSGSSDSSKDSKGKETLDLIKNLFKEVAGKGLPVDVNAIYTLMTNLFSKYQAFGEELDTNDIALMYLQSMQQLNGVMHSKEVYEKAKAYATQNDALSEIAVTADGKYIAQRKDNTGELIEVRSLEELRNNENLVPVTNQQLLFLREHHPLLLLQKGDYFIENVINNGMGINKIGAQIKALAGNIGSTEGKLEGISLVESGKVKAGLEMLAEAPNGHYKISTATKSQQEQINAALKYINNMLSPALKATLEAHGGVQLNIMYFLGSQLDYTKEVSISPLTGKAAKDTKDSNDKILSDPLMLMIQGLGGTPRTWNLITKDSNIKMSVDGIEYSQLPKIKEDMSLDKMLSESGIGGILDSKQGITFGDQNISPDLFKDIMYSNSGGMVVTLPCKIVNGHKEVNLGVKESYEKAVQEVESKGISRNSEEYYKVLGEVLKQKGLNSLLDSNGYPDKNKFGLFLVVEAYTTNKVKNLDTSSQYIEKVKNPDALLEERMIRALSTDSKKSNYSLDIDYWIWGDDVYRGTVFIPLTNNLNSAVNAWGNLISVENARELEKKFQKFNKASNVKSSNSDVL